jgi:hypothetical protein
MQAAAGRTPVATTRAALARAVHTARTPAGRVPAALQAHVRATLEAPAGVRFENAHRLRTPHGPLWLTDLGRATCLIRAADGALSCDTTAHVARHGLTLTVFTVRDGHRHDFLLFGLALDWAKHARVRTAAGHVRTVPVRDNAYAAASREDLGLLELLR